ncbi:hypothetical protein [Neobacillus mesonae]|uniref:Phage tail tape measure protein n=1 Tax=Neobacillus mesonae TaxID=1193713 RepID=A0A3T0HVT6_9BACI|nr:hypothetical protein [Neobacillus mesonae]AZU61078.1 hypothetical protein CHR53_07320 [Neobacillus mesonae]
MVRRFEFPRKVMNNIKNLPIKEQLVELDKYFNKIGMTQKLIDEMGGTTLGIWAQIQEKTQVLFRDMGKPALGVIKKFLDELNGGLQGGNFSGFQQTGAKILKGIAEGFISAAKGIGSWIDQIRNSPQFQNADLAMKVGFIFDDIGQRFSEWLANGGQDKLNAAGKTLMEIVAAAILASEPIIVKAAVSIGTAIGSALVSSASQSFYDMWSKSPIANLGFGDFKPIKWITDAGRSVGKKIFSSPGGKTSAKKSPSSPSLGAGSRKPMSYAGGLARVPYNSYPALLHKNERVLTAEEAQEYNAGKSGKTVNVSFAGANFNVRQESDIQKIAYELAKLIEREGALA